MSHLKEKILADFKKALEERDELKIATLRLLKAEILNKEKEKRYKVAKKEKGLSEEELQEKSQLFDEELLEVLTSEVKKRKEAIESFRIGGREDLVKKEEKELEILKSYLPAELSEEALKKLISEAIKIVGAQGEKDFGRVMNILVPKIKGRTDIGQAAKIVREMLSKD